MTEAVDASPCLATGSLDDKVLTVSDGGVGSGDGLVISGFESVTAGLSPGVGKEGGLESG